MQKLTLVRYEVDGDAVISEFACDFVAQCDGTSIWSDTADKAVRVTGITVITNVYEGDAHTTVNVTHDSGWDIYTDEGFESAISDALGFDVQFTEQGMQEDELASLEC